MKCELLAPAGSYDIAVAALNSGADAVYLATEQFGARAYAKNLTLDELEKIVNYANVLNKKIYVTCNILIKDDELDAVFKYLNKISTIRMFFRNTYLYGFLTHIMPDSHFSSICFQKTLCPINKFA